MSWTAFLWNCRGKGQASQLHISWRPHIHPPMGIDDVYGFRWINVIPTSRDSSSPSCGSQLSLWLDHGPTYPGVFWSDGLAFHWKKHFKSCSNPARIHPTFLWNCCHVANIVHSRRLLKEIYSKSSPLAIFSISSRPAEHLFCRSLPGLNVHLAWLFGSVLITPFAGRMLL